MVLVDVDILDEEDDWQVKHVTGNEYTAEYNASNATWGYQRYGTPATDFTGNRVFYLFRGITIPQGSSITDATLTIPQVERNGTLDVPFSIRAVNNSAPTKVSDYQGATGTGPAFNTPVLTPVVTFTANTATATDYPVDVKDHVQALVNAFDYSNDNMLFRMAKTPNTTTTQAFSAQNFEYQVNPPATIANLTINYIGTVETFTVDAILKLLGANGACPVGGEVVSSVLDNIDDFDTQVNTTLTNFKIGQRWTPTVGEVTLLEKGITKLNLWHGHTGGSGSFDTFIWSNASVGTSSETEVADGGTFTFFGSSSTISKRNRTLFDVPPVTPTPFLPTAGVEYVLGIVEDFPGTAQTRKTSTDTNNGVFTTRSSAGNWTDTAGQDWALQLTIEKTGLGQGDQNLCLGVDGKLRLIQTQQFTVDAILVTPVVTNTKNFLIDGLLAIMPSRLTCVDAVLQAFGITETFEVDALLDVVAIETKDFTVDALIQSLGQNGQCPIPATETFYSRAKSQALAERLGEGVNSPFANISRSGIKILGSTHAGKAIEDIRVLGLRRNGTGATGSLFATVRSQDDTVITTSTNSVLAEDLPTTGAGDDITFTFDEKVVLQDGYKILVEFPNCIGCADSSNEPTVFWFGTSTASPAGTSRVAFGKSDTVNPGAYTTETTTGFTQGGTISFTTSAAEPAEQRGCAEVDAVLKSLGDNGLCIRTYMDNFDTDRFIDMDSSFIQVSTGSSRMEFQPQTDNTNDASASDISLVGRFGSILPATWRIRFSINFQTYSLGENNHMMFSIGDEDQTTNSRTSAGSLEQSIGFHATTTNSASTQRVRGYHKDGATQINTATNLLQGDIDTMTGTKFYQIERTSDTSVTYSIFSDSGFTTLINSATQTIPNLTGLQYFKVSNWQFANNTEGSIDGVLDNLEIVGLSPNGSVACLIVDAIFPVPTIEQFTVDALIQSQGTCTETTKVFDQISGNAGLWTEVDGAGEIEIDLAGSGVLEWNNLRGGGTSIETFAHRTIPNFADNAGVMTLRLKVDKISDAAGAAAPTGRFLVLQNNDLHPNPSTGSSFQLGLGSGTTNGGMFCSISDGTASLSTSPQLNFPNGTTKYLEGIYDPVAQTLTLNVYTDAGFSVHDTGSPVQVDASSISMPGLTFTHMITSNVKNSGSARVLSADLDDFRVIAGGCPSFSVDAQLLQLITVQTKDFEVDAFFNRQTQFIVDVSITPDTGVVRDVGDLIVRVLFENDDLGGSGLTGRQVVDEIVAITTVELQWGFRGKNSRIRSWLNTLKFRGVVQEDGSDPDWYETIWTLV